MNRVKRFRRSKTVGLKDFRSKDLSLEDLRSGGPK